MTRLSFPVPTVFYPGDESFRLFAGGFIDGTGSPRRKNVLMTIDAGRITAIEAHPFQKKLPPDTMDLGGSLVIPGLVDCHVHLLLSGTRDPAARKRQLHLTYAAAETAILRHLKQQRQYGVVAVRDGGDYGGYVARFLQESALIKAGLPGVRAAGKALHARGRYGRLVGEGVPADEALAGRIGSRGGDHVKLINSGLNSLREFGRQTAPQFKEEALRAAIRAAHDRGLAVMVHANGVIPVQEAIRAGADSIEHGFFMGRENLERMAEAGVTWVPTAFTMQGYIESMDAGGIEMDIAGRNLDHQLEQIRLGTEIGVTIATGTDAGSMGVHHGRALYRELDMLMDAGLSLEKAVMCGSSNGAKLLKIQAETGTLSPGMPARWNVLPGGFKNSVAIG